MRLARDSRLGTWLWQLDRLVDRRQLAMDRFADTLREIGFVPGATVMVHSSMDELSRRVPGLNALQLVRTLRELVGEQGTLLMPTFPFVGRQIHYVDAVDEFDVRRTPSRVGLVTEVFRRSPGVVRSLHPTHSVAAWGRHAGDLVASHHLGTAFGETSPFFRLQEHDGLVVGLGVGLREGFTILHVAEELHPRVRSLVFDPRPRRMRLVEDSTVLPYDLLPLRANVTRDLKRMEKLFRADGTLLYTVRGGLLFSCARAERFIQRGLELLDRGCLRVET